VGNRRALVLVMAFLLSACTSPQVATPRDGAPTELRLKAGDTIRVVTKHRERFSFEITDVGATELSGLTVKPRKPETRPKGERVVVPYADLALVEVRRVSLARTAAPIAIVLVSAGLVMATGSVPPTMPQ
jgi:hypothetical protein